jgi:hypothetical protein
MTTLAETMNAARDAAANVPATQDTTGTAVATTGSAPDQQFNTGLDDFLSGGGIRPDKWIQVKDMGLRIDKDEKAYATEFVGDLDLSSVQLFWGARAEFAGNKVVYTKSYDGVTTNKGENFKAVLADFKAGSLKDASPYRGADVLIELTEEVTQGKTVIPAGTKVGYSTSITGFAPFQSFLSAMVKAGKARSGPNGTIEGETVRVRVKHDPRTNNAKQDYGVLLFELAE